VGLTQHLQATILAQRGHMFGWVPVALACGIGWYFLAKVEPGFATCALVSAAGVAAVASLKADVGIPARLRDVGVTKEQLPGFAEIASGLVRILRVNTREASREDLESILRSAF